MSKQTKSKCSNQNEMKAKHGRQSVSSHYETVNDHSEHAWRSFAILHMCKWFNCVSGSLQLVHRYFTQLITKRCPDSGSPLADVDGGRSGSATGARLLTYWRSIPFLICPSTSSFRCLQSLVLWPFNSWNTQNLFDFLSLEVGSLRIGLRYGICSLVSW